MAISYKSLNTVGWPAGADTQVFSGTSSTGLYTYSSGLTAGTYVFVASSPSTGGNFSVVTTSNGSGSSQVGTPLYFTFANSDAAVKIQAPISPVSTTVSNTTAISFTGVAYGNGLYMAANYNSNGSNRPTISSNGSFFYLATNTASSSPYYQYGVLYALGKFVLYGYQQGSNSWMATTTDGISWVQGPNDGNGWTAYCMVYGTKFVVGAFDANYGAVKYSTDAVTWSGGNIPFTSTGSPVQAVCWNSTTSRYLMSNGGETAISTDGATWTKTYSSGFYKLGVIGSLYVGSNGNGSYTSTDGTTWTLRNSVAISNYNYGGQLPTVNGAVYITGNSGVWSSTDGITWSIVNFSGTSGVNTTTVTGANNRVWVGAYHTYGTGLLSSSPAYFSAYKISSPTALN